MILGGTNNLLHSSVKLFLSTLWSLALVKKSCNNIKAACKFPDYVISCDYGSLNHCWHKAGHCIHSSFPSWLYFPKQEAQKSHCAKRAFHCRLSKRISNHGFLSIETQSRLNRGFKSRLNFHTTLMKNITLIIHDKDKMFKMKYMKHL